LAVVFGAGQSSAQSQYSQSRAEYEQRLAELEAKLDALSRERAGEYLDVLERLYDVLDEYSDYVAELVQDAGFEGELSIDDMKQDVRDGLYADQPERLLDDIYALIDEVKPLEAQLRVKYHSNEPKGSRVLRNFRRELIIVAELVEDYTDQQMTRLLKKDEINDYIKTALESAMKALAQLRADDQTLPPALPEVPLPPQVPVIPRVEPPPAPDVPDQRDKIEQFRSQTGGRTGRIQTYTANMTVGSDTRPVKIENTVGDLVVIGGEDRNVSALLLVEVSATSSEKEKEFVSLTTLKVEALSDGYHVYSVLPRIGDVKTEVLRSRLEVSIPADNRLVCTSSYGEINVSDVNRGVAIDGDNCRIMVDNVSGGAKIENLKGEVILSEIRGELEIFNSHSPVTVSGCDGRMTIETTNGYITLSDNRGLVTITGTGQITVSDHQGDISIENRNGAVAISEVNGSVKASNAFDHLSVTDVSGEVKVINSYGNINLIEIMGIITADNTAGSTIIEAVRGPIDVISRTGNVSLMLDEDFRGRSTVNSVAGTIQVKIAEPPNLTMLIHTSGGTITSNLPIKVYQEGINRSTELVLGEGGETLDLSGTNSSIIISGRF